MSNLKVALCCIGRLENRYAKEFVEHYLKLGIDHIFVYDNNFGDEEHFEDVLKDYIKLGSVEVINARDKIRVQNLCYNDCYAKHKNEYDWFAFLDFDEYLVLEKNRTIQEFLEEKKGFDCVLINWKCMSDNNLVHYEDKPLMERFTEECPINLCVQYEGIPENMHVKSIVRGSLKSIEFNGNPHVPSNNIICCNADGNECNKSPFQPISWTTAYIKHFTTKTIDEWLMNKLKKGVADRDYDLFLKTYKYRFFKYNQMTKEKEDFIRAYAQKERKS